MLELTDHERDQAEKSVALVREFTGSEPFEAVIALLGHTAKSYQADLVSVPAEELIQKQTALKQVCAIRDLLMGKTDFLPKV